MMMHWYFFARFHNNLKDPEPIILKNNFVVLGCGNDGI
jgi:hypothetical protein